MKQILSVNFRSHLNFPNRNSENYTATTRLNRHICSLPSDKQKFEDHSNIRGAHFILIRAKVIDIETK
jgi:hypothetical protein